jgi:putative SOS response-associated peptidase YedK
MCGRYTLTQVGPRLVDERFGLGEVAIEPATLGRFNVCPTEDILIVTHKGPRTVRWGLVPSWSKAVGQGPLLINARAETVASKKVFSRLLGRPERRCLVIADGWYEWLRSEKKSEPRVPFHYRVDGGELFAFAGLCDVAKIDGEWVPSATILTTTANEVCAPVHDRMPVVLAGPDEEAAWLEGESDGLLGPLDAGRTAVAPANPAVNKAGVEGEELLKPPPEEEPAQLRLAT